MLGGLSEMQLTECLAQACTMGVSGEDSGDMCMCVCTCIYVFCICVLILCICVYLYISVCLRIYGYTCMQVCMHVYIPVCVYSCVLITGFITLTLWIFIPRPTFVSDVYPGLGCH